MIRLNPNPTDCLLPLQLLCRGQTGLVDHVFGQPEQVARLHEIGIRPGVSLEMVQPGAPCVVRLSRQNLCFRESEMLGILVRPGALD